MSKELKSYNFSSKEDTPNTVNLPKSNQPKDKSSKNNRLEKNKNNKNKHPVAYLMANNTTIF